MAAYGLIGKKLAHSFSQAIHEKLGDVPYSLIPLLPDQLDGFLKRREFSGINITIPYKKDVIPYCDMLDGRAKAIGAVNTIVNRNGRLYGYNTDFDGFSHTLRSNRIAVDGKVALVLGNGGASQTVQAVLKEQGAGEVLVASRNPIRGTISYAEALRRPDVEIVVNATPVGMYPNTGESPLGLSGFKRLTAVIDLIYNPLRTALLMEAEEMHIPAVNGLFMLVAQAKAAAELFRGESIPDERTDEIYRDLRVQKSNLVLTGMPMSGKSTVGRIAADILQKEFVDIDQAIEEKAGLSIPEIFERFNEAGFRELEQEVVKEVSLRNGLVISTGGGTPLFRENIRNLRQNGCIAFLDRPLSQLSVGKGRPLAKSREEIEALYFTRYPIYRSSCDFVVDNRTEAGAAAENLARQYRQNC